VCDKIGFFQDAPNSYSMMRLVVFIVVILGGVVTLCGLGAFLGRLPESVSVIALGLGIVGSAEVLKLVQTRYENK